MNRKRCHNASLERDVGKLGLIIYQKFFTKTAKSKIFPTTPVAKNLRFYCLSKNFLIDDEAHWRNHNFFDLQHFYILPRNSAKTWPIIMILDNLEFAISQLQNEFIFKESVQKQRIWKLKCLSIFHCIALQCIFLGFIQVDPRLETWLTLMTLFLTCKSYWLSQSRLISSNKNFLKKRKKLWKKYRPSQDSSSGLLVWWTMLFLDIASSFSRQWKIIF